MNPAYNYVLKYRKFDSLLADVRVDLRNISTEGRIDPQPLIKVALRCNYDLGLRINQTKEAVIEVCHRKAKLPNDFYVMNFALLCGECVQLNSLPQGTHIEDRILPKYQVLPPINGCVTPEPIQCAPTHMPPSNSPPCLNQCGDGIELVRIVNYETRTYRHMMPLNFVQARDLCEDSPHHRWGNGNLEGGGWRRDHRHDTAWIKDGYLFTSFEEGEVYVNYEGCLEDANGDLLVVDHHGLNPYYEWALKERIVENLIFDGEVQEMTPMLQMIEPKLRAARNNALSITNMPNFSDMMNLWSLNRRAQVQKYFQMFSSYQYNDNYDERNII